MMPGADVLRPDTALIMYRRTLRKTFGAIMACSYGFARRDGFRGQRLSTLVKNLQARAARTRHAGFDEYQASFCIE